MPFFRRWMMKKKLCILAIMLIIITATLVLPVTAHGATNPYSGGWTNCTWACWQIVYENTGIELPDWGETPVDWYEKARAAGYTLGSSPRNKSIAVWRSTKPDARGHVAYFESYGYLIEGGYRGTGYRYLDTQEQYGYREYGDERDQYDYYMLGYIYLDDQVHDPKGEIQMKKAPYGFGTIHLEGWAKDPDEPDTALHIYLSVGGPLGHPNAEVYDAGVTNLIGNHSFDLYVPIVGKRDTQEIWVYAANVGAGSHTLLVRSHYYFIYEPFTGIEMNQTNITVWEGETIRLVPYYYTTFPKTSSFYPKPVSPNVRWSISDHDIAQISYTDGQTYGSLTGKKRGTGTITVITEDGGCSDSCTYTVLSHDPHGELDLVDGGKGTINVSGWAKDDDDSQRLNILVSIGGPKGSSGAEEHDIGKASKFHPTEGSYGFDETITTEKRGTQEVYIYAENIGQGNDKLLGSRTVTIQERGPVLVEGVSLDATSTSMLTSTSVLLPGQSDAGLQLTATVSPADADNKQVRWSSSDTSVATVDDSGCVSGVKPGTVTITATTVDGGKTAECKVKVMSRKEIALKAGSKYVFKSKLSNNYSMDVMYQNNPTNTNVSLYKTTEKRGAQIFTVEKKVVKGKTWWLLTRKNSTVGSRAVTELNGKNLVFGTNKYTNWQIFRAYQFNDGTVQFINRGSNKAIAVEGGVAANRANIAPAKANLSNSQRWKCVVVG